MITVGLFGPIIFEIAIRQVVIGLSVREGVGGESFVDIAYLTFQKSI